MGRRFMINGEQVQIHISTRNDHISEVLMGGHYTLGEIIRSLVEKLEQHECYKSEDDSDEMTPEAERNRREIGEAIFAFSYVLKEGYCLENVSYR